MGGCQSLKGLREVTFFIAHQAFGRRSMRIVAIVGAAIGGDGVDKCVVCHLPTRRLLCMMRRRNCMGHLNMVINLKPYCCVVLGLLLLHLPILHWSSHAWRGTRRRTTSCMNESFLNSCASGPFQYMHLKIELDWVMVFAKRVLRPASSVCIQ